MVMNFTVQIVQITPDQPLARICPDTLPLPLSFLQGTLIRAEDVAVCRGTVH